MRKCQAVFEKKRGQFRILGKRGDFLRNMRIFMHRFRVERCFYAEWRTGEKADGTGIGIGKGAWGGNRMMGSERAKTEILFAKWLKFLREICRFILTILEKSVNIEKNTQAVKLSVLP